jgi:Tropinone reductase 1
MTCVYLLVTGSTKGIGKATAEEFLHLGASVVVTARSQEAVDSLCAEWGKDYPGKIFGCTAGLCVCDCKCLGCLHHRFHHGSMKL